jgi:hypothetical protein
VKSYKREEKRGEERAGTNWGSFGDYEYPAACVKNEAFVAGLGNTPYTELWSSSMVQALSIHCSLLYLVMKRSDQLGSQISDVLGS